MAVLQIFLSAVSAEFRNYRDALRHDLARPNVTVAVQEDFIVTGTETLGLLDRYITECDAVIHLVGDMTGAVALAPSVAFIRQRYPDFGERLAVVTPFLQSDGPLLPYTQWEAWLALYHGKPLIICAPEEGAPRFERYQMDVEQRAAQQAHLARLAGIERYPAIRFANADRLAVDVLRSDLHNILQQSLSLARFAPPIVPPHFRDREQEMQSVEERLRRGHACALVAIGGSGKTAIAARIADQSAGEGHNVVWLGLAGTSDVDVPQEWLANAFGFSVRSEMNGQQRSARLRSITARSSTLVVLDDPVSEAQLVELIASIGSGNDVLVTTRQQLPSFVRLGVSVVEIPPLAKSDAADVLLAVLGKDPGATIDRREWEALAQAAGNHPLSLEVLAGDLMLQDQLRPELYMKERIANGTWSEYDDTLVRLRKTLVDNIARARVGYEAAFSALGAFEGSTFSADAVAKVCAFDSDREVSEFLLELRRRLCLRRLTSGMYSLHPFITETARQMQTPHAIGSVAKSAPLRRHIAYYDELLEKYGGYEFNLGRYPSLLPEERELVHAIETAAMLAESAARDVSSELRVSCTKMTSKISWYLHWRGHWDLRIRLCERVCAWAEQKLLPLPDPEMSTIVGNLYVDQGWIHLHRADTDRAMLCASQGKKWLRYSGDLIFAEELSGQVSMRGYDFPRAIQVFESLRDRTPEGSRAWLVFSYRLVDALYESGESVRGLALLESLVQRSEMAAESEQTDDVRGRILYRLAWRRHDAGRVADATTLARHATTAFAQSGIIAPERRAAIGLLADLLNRSGSAQECVEFLTMAKHQAEKEGDFETLTEIEHRLVTPKTDTVVVPSPTRLADI